MRRIFRILLFFAAFGYSVSSYAGGPVAYLNFASFSTPGGQNYFETYLSVVGSSLKFVKNGNNKYAAKAHVTISFKSGDSVIKSSSFNVLSPEINDTVTKPNFSDVHRFWLPKGNYTLVFTLDDPSDASHKMISGRQPVRVGYPTDSVVVSDAEFLSSLTPSATPAPYNKCGFDLVPYVFQLYPQTMKMLKFYCEIYNTVKCTGQHEKVVIKYAIENEGPEVTLSDNFVRSIVRDADTVIPFMAQIPIDKLPSGDYSLAITVLNKNNHVLGKRKFSFRRDNPGIKSVTIPAGFAVYMQSRDTLEESIRCLAPISTKGDQAYVTSDSLNWVPTAELKRFFYYFWVAKDSLYPLQAWKSYLDKVIAVNNTFKTPGIKGYRTDRGRVYLQYGAPNQRSVSNMNPETYPYEIWQYYIMPNGETNRKFVFYNRDLVTNNYVLLHSTATGETHNPHWQIELYSRLGTPSNLDIQQIDDDLGEDVNNQFNNPH